MKYDTFLKNQKNVLKLFSNSFKKNRLVHTYLFEGPRGTSKLEGAYYFSQLILCTNKQKAPCMECFDCMRVMEGNHPSIFLIEPDGEVIKKEQVEALEKEFSLTSISEGKRVYIIKDIDKATSSAANSLLKFFEEMGKDNYGVLTTENINMVLPTIRSRSQIVFFQQISEISLIEELIDKGVDEEVSRILAKLTNSISDALKLIEEGIILDLIELVKKIEVMLIREESPVLVALTDEDNILFSLKDKKYHNLFLDLLIMFANDKIYYSLNQLDRIVFKNTLGAVGMYVKEDLDELLSRVEMILEFKERLKYNLNIELFYTQLFIEMSR